MSFGIYFSCDVPGNAVSYALAANNRGYAELLFVRIEIIREVIPLLCKEFGTDRFNV